MFVSKFKTLAATSVALTALLALGACNKKVEDTNVVPAPAPMTTPSTDTPAPSSGMSTPAPSMGSSAPMGPSGSGSSTMSPTVSPQASPASEPGNK